MWPLVILLYSLEKGKVTRDTTRGDGDTLVRNINTIALFVVTWTLGIWHLSSIDNPGHSSDSLI